MDAATVYPMPERPVAHRCTLVRTPIPARRAPHPRPLSARAAHSRGGAERRNDRTRQGGEGSGDIYAGQVTSPPGQPDGSERKYKAHKTALRQGQSDAGQVGQ